MGASLFNSASFLFITVSVFLLLAFLPATTSASSKKPPHIVIVIIDDAGTQDIGYNASPESAIHGKTPVIDSLAADAVRLKEYYAHPVCTPTRAALLTGRYAVNTGMPFPLLAHAVAGLSSSVPTLPEVLKEGGYKTHLVGKYHCGNAKPSMVPTARGFDTFFGVIGGGIDHYNKGAGGTIDLWRGTTQIREEDVDITDHATNLFSREAISVIENHAQNEKDNPLFLYLSYTAPHDPLQADPEFLAKCKDVPNRHRRAFCGMMAQLDSGIGNVTQTLKDQGLWEDTVFMFTSDNGGNPVVGGFNYMYRGAKSTAWEGGSRVPGFVRAPERFNFVAQDFYGLVHVSDWMPTFMTLAGIENPPVATDARVKMDGHDLTRSFQQKGQGGLQDSPRQSVLMQHDVFMNSTAYRSGCLKLILGCPGTRVLNLEPDHRLLRALYEPEEGVPAAVDKIGDCMSEWMHEIIERIIPTPIDQFFKYSFTIQLSQVRDWFAGTSYNHIINPRYQDLGLWRTTLIERPPVLDWSLDHGPKVMLYDLCADPGERHNLAFDGPERRAQVEQLLGELLEVIQDAPLQFAGDTMVILKSEGNKVTYSQRLAPFLEEDVDMAAFDEVVGRLFHFFRRVFVYAEIAVGLLILLIFVLMVRYLRRGGRKAATNGSAGGAAAAADKKKK